MYKIKQGIPWQKLDENIIILTPEKHMAHELNEVGTFIWLAISEGHSQSVITNLICEEYNIDIPGAKSDLSLFMTDLEQKGLLEKHE